MIIKMIHLVINKTISPFLFAALFFIFMTNSSIALESDKVTILYGACGMGETKVVLVDMPKSSVFPHNNFKNDTIFLRFDRKDGEWLLNQGFSDAPKMYSRQAVRLAESNVLSKIQTVDCLELYVRFQFLDKQE